MKINELEDLLGVSKATVRYYEDQGLVTPQRSENGYREYSDEDVQLFQKIIVLRKLGLSMTELRDLIDGKAELDDVLSYNIEKLRTRQDEIASAIELCGKIKAEASDFSSIDSPIQNKQFSDHSDKPLPADIRANKKEGDEYATIGSVYKKGGKLKIVLIAVILFYIALGMFNGLCVWGGLGYNAKNVIDFNKSGMTFFKPNDEELAQIAAVDSDVVDALQISY